MIPVTEQPGIMGLRIGPSDNGGVVAPSLSANDFLAPPRTITTWLALWSEHSEAADDDLLLDLGGATDDRLDAA